MAGGVFSRVIAALPGSLSHRVTLLVCVAFLMGALVSGWTIYNLYKRSSALNEAQSSGELLRDLIRQGASETVPSGATLTSGPFQLRRNAALVDALPGASIPLILDLDGARWRTAIAFQDPPQLPDALRASTNAQTGAARLADLSRGIARQDQAASLHVFLPESGVLTITAPRIWQDRLGQTWVALIGASAFALGLSAVVLLALNLATPFVRLATRDADTQRSDPLASTEALLIGDRIAHLMDRFRAEEDRKSRGLAAISHDLRTPVTRMRLRAELLEDEALRDRFEADLDEISGIIDGALDLLSLRSQPEESYRFSLVSLLDSLVDDYRDTGKRVELLTTGEVELRSAGSIFATSEDVTIKAANACLMQGQPDKLRRAFSNLIDNALKFGGRAVVEVTPHSHDMLNVSIRDFGPGIDPAQIERILLPFSRGHAAASQPGVGLGLSIASELIEMHGGSLSFTNMDPGLLVTAHIGRGF